MSENDLPPLRDVIRLYDLRAQKKFGQNFLLDPNLTDKIVRSARKLEGVSVLEVGPGPGGLTRSLLKSAACHVTAIEIDPRAVSALEDLKKHFPERLSVIQGDALRLDLQALASPPRAIVANLPYNVATPLLISWLKQIREDPAAFSSMTLMFQKEVAQRIVAKAGNENYGRLSVACQWLCAVGRLFDLPPEAFTPPPKVTSSVVHFIPKPLHSGAPAFETVQAVTAAAFNKRRKMIRTSLGAYKEILETLNLDLSLRAQNLEPEDYINIARASETLDKTADKS